MIRALFTAALLIIASTAHGAEFWDSLWRNADQRGDQLMHQGKAAAAASTYTDPQRKAYAELQAGNYQNAARDLAAYQDSTSHYNRGNALAQSGQLQDAIKAYDAALARDPNNRDARHNRDLVAKALQQQPTQSKPPASKEASSSDSHQDQGNNKDKQNKSGSPQDNKGQSSPDPQSGAGQANKKPDGNSGQNQQQAGNSQQPQSPPPSNNPAPANPAAQAKSAPQPVNDAAQAQRDATTALNKSATSQMKPAPGDLPATEQKMAQEQWLRSIPDDPGGLLRRKFMIEHLIRQQGTAP